jgi:hypothetical protein
MTLEKLENLGIGNPFLLDHFYMGQSIGINQWIMFSKHETQKQDYIILIDSSTGERVKIHFGEPKRMSLAEMIMNENIPERIFGEIR